MTIPIRDPEKNPTPDELEALQVHPSISQAVPIDPVLLDSETSSVDFQIDPEMEEAIEDIKDSNDSGSESDASIDSIARNADFVSFGY